MGSLVAWMESSVRLAGSSGPGPMLSSRWDYELAFCCLGTMSVHGISCLGEATGFGGEPYAALPGEVLSSGRLKAVCSSTWSYEFVFLLSIAGGAAPRPLRLFVDLAQADLCPGSLAKQDPWLCSGGHQLCPPPS